MREPFDNSHAQGHEVSVLSHIVGDLSLLQAGSHTTRRVDAP